MSANTIIALVDDDGAVLDSLSLYLVSKGYQVRCLTSAAALLDALDTRLAVDCIVSDVRMPGLSGIDLHRTLVARGSRCPLILITGHGDIETAVAAIKAGAYDFLQKPFDEQRLVSAIENAVSQSNKELVDVQELSELEAKVAELSERQHQVMMLAVQGCTNKEIARQLEISVRTVESYRSWVMERTGARNLAELVRISMRLGLCR